MNLIFISCVLHYKEIQTWMGKNPAHYFHSHFYYPSPWYNLSNLDFYLPQLSTFNLPLHNQQILLYGSLTQRHINFWYGMCWPYIGVVIKPRPRLYPTQFFKSFHFLICTNNLLSHVILYSQFPTYNLYFLLRSIFSCISRYL